MNSEANCGAENSHNTQTHTHKHTFTINEKTKSDTSQAHRFFFLAPFLLENNLHMRRSMLEQLPGQPQQRVLDLLQQPPADNVNLLCEKQARRDVKPHPAMVHQHVAVHARARFDLGRLGEWKI